MNSVVLDKETVEKKLKKLKIFKSPGIDNIHRRMFKELSLVISHFITNLYNHSLASGQLPEDWKLSNITILFKKGSRSNVGNYKSISLICILCKILEYIISDKIMEYFISNDLLSTKQFGFIKGRFILIQLIKLSHTWTFHLVNYDGVDVIYTDYEKAFDTVPHY